MADINLGVGAANSASDAYEIANSLKFEADNTEYLSHSSSSGSGTKVTYSFWCKRTELDSSSYMQVSGISTNSETVRFMFYQDSVRLDAGNSSTGKILVTNRKFRDTSAWYHFFVVIDTTLATEGDRHQLWVNGVRETSFSTEQYPTQNFSVATDQNNATWRYGAYDSTYYKFSGYLAECYRLDGIAASCTDFGEFDSDSGIWIPKEYTSSFGSNGHYLDFEDSSSLGTDDSGNGNNFTLNNIAAADQATDTPTNNFATLNPLWNVYNEVQRFTVTEGGTTITGNQSSTLWRGVPATIPVNSGKWYWEVERGNSVNGILVGAGSIEGGSAGWVDWRELTSIPSGGKAKMMYSYNRGIYGYSASQDAWQYGGGNFNTAGDIISVALDLDNGYMYFRQNGGSWFGSGDPSSGSSGTGAIGINWNSDGDFTVPVVTVPNNTVDCRVNFGGYTETSIASGNSDANGYGNFEYAVPSGYYAICTKNVAEYG